MPPSSYPLPPDGMTALPVVKTQQTVVDYPILNGQSSGAIVDLGVQRVIGIHVPAGFEGTLITPNASHDGVTGYPVYDSAGLQKTITAGASRRVVLSPADYIGVRYLKLTSNNAMGADRVLKLICEG